MDTFCIELDPETQMYCTLHLFINVENTFDIRKKIVTGKLHCCMVKASLIADIFQAVVAANKAALNAKQNRLITKSVYTEVLLSLSMSNKISRSLSEFGIGDNDKNILAILIHKVEEKQSLLEELISTIKGERVPVSRIEEFADLNLIKKTYKINEEELSVSNLTDAIVSKINCKEFLLLK